MEDELLLLDKVCSGYGEVQILREVSIELGKGEAVALIGPNGHGKSTILKTISGVVKLDAGKITFEGKRIDGLAPQRIVELGLIHVPEGSRLFPQMSVIENLSLGAFSPRAWKMREANLRRVFDLFPKLKERRGQLASSLSGGERQMVALGRGLMADARLLMVDEPSLGLAPIVADEVSEKISEIRDTGVGLIVVEQNAKRISKGFKRAYLIENGRVRLQGQPEQVLADEHLKKVFLGKR